MDTLSGIYGPYLKDNNTPIYINVERNHPPLVLKQIPLGIEKRLSDISENKEIFDSSKKPYQKALADAGYNHTLEYKEKIEKPKPKNKPRIRDVTWYNPPFNK